MICAAVFETDERVRELLREWTVEYLIRENRICSGLPRM